jgi:hypothetical protein
MEYLKVKKSVFIFLVILLFLNSGCSITNRVFHTSTIYKFEQRKFNPKRKLSQEEQMIATRNSRRNRNQEQLIEESSGGISRIIPDNSSEEQPVKKKDEK